MVMNMDELRRVVEQSGNRLLLLEVKLDSLDDRQVTVPVESWVVLTAPEDAPDRSRLVSSLWQSLSALALDADSASRVHVCRWALKAEEALRLTSP